MLPYQPSQVARKTRREATTKTSNRWALGAPSEEMAEAAGVRCEPVEQRGGLRWDSPVPHSLSRTILTSRNVSPDGNLEDMEPRLLWRNEEKEM